MFDFYVEYKIQYVIKLQKLEYIGDLLELVVELTLTNAILGHSNEG